ncbi:MAG: MMPL family transporter [Planctomycetales bacterium]|nr:MMPL family transporter [Planctomycetales bacterium]
MKDCFYSKKSVFGVPTALILLMAVFFFVPFAGRGARMALQRTENNVKDWLPSDFRETEELAWFAKRFVSEQFIVATWKNCTLDDQRLKMFVSKLKNEMAPTADVDPTSDYYRAQRLGADYALFTTDDLHFDWGGKNEKWLVDEHGKAFYITPDGRLYRWEGNPNVVSAAWRLVARATGSFHLEGQFVAALGDPGVEDAPNPFWSNPRLITAPLFKTVEAGPDVVEHLAGESGSLATPTEPVAGRRDAISRLTGTLFGPAVPTGFQWQSAELRELLSEEKLSELPAEWETTWDLVIQQHVDEHYGGDLNAFKQADPVDQSKAWYEFFDAIAVDEPPRQTCVVITLTEVARRNLQRVIGRGMMGQPFGRVFQISQECGVQPPPRPTTAPPPFSWFAKNLAATEPVLHIGGPPVDNVAIDEEGTITLVRLIGYSIALGLGLSLLCLRSIKLMTMVFFVGGVSAMTSLSLVWWSNASVDAILLTMPSLVYVLGMSGAVHIVNYYRDAVIEQGEELAPERAIAHAVVPCTLAALTTAIGLLSLCSSNILPIRKFGIFSAMGVMATLVLLYIYLPSALTVFPPKRKALEQAGQKTAQSILNFWERLGRFILRRHWWVNAVCFGLLIGLGVGLLKIRTSVQLLKLFDSQSQIIKDYAWLEENFGRLVPMELVVRFPETLQRIDVANEELTTEQTIQSHSQLSFLERAEAVGQIQDVLQRQFGYSGQNVIGRAMSAITFLPNMPAPSNSTFNAARLAADRMLKQQRSQLLATDYLALEPATSPSKNMELWRISLRLGALNDVDYGQFVTTLRAGVEPVVAAYRCRRAVVQSILDNPLDDSERLRGDVLVLGHGKPKPASSAVVGGSDGQIPAETELPKTDDGKVDGVEILCETLANCLMTDRIRLVNWHDPDTHPLDEGKATSEKWADYLSRHSCVVIVADHPDYDLDFIRGANPNVIHAEEMLANVNVHLNENRIAGGPAIESSTVSGEMDVVYTGVVPVVYKAQRTLLVSLVESVAWAFVLIALVMACLLSPARSFMSAFHPANMFQGAACGAISMIPNVFPVVAIFGFMGHANILVDIGSMMTASVAMGVAVDDTIHFLTWFRDGLRRGLDRREAVFAAYKHVAPAMTQTTIIGGLGLSVFALSTFTPTQRFGTLMLTLLAAALVGDLIFLPALLASPLGRVFAMRKRQPATEEESNQVGKPHLVVCNDSTADMEDEYRLADPDQDGLQRTDQGDGSIPSPRAHAVRDGSQVRRRV